MTVKLSDPSFWSIPQPHDAAAADSPRVLYRGVAVGNANAEPAPRANHAAYDEDLYAWASDQAVLLRVGQPYEADLANIAEEIEDLGKSRRDKLVSHITTVIEHLMKLQASPAKNPRAGWCETIMRARDEIEDVLAESPSLRSQVAEIIAKQEPRARRYVAMRLRRYGEGGDRLASLSYSEDQVIGDWFPE